jgi:hypothetical protein
VIVAYIGTIITPGAFPHGPDMCGEGSAFAWDDVTEECFPVSGLGVPISPNRVSAQGGYEIFNLNINFSIVSRPSPTQLALEGPIYTGVG